MSSYPSSSHLQWAGLLLLTSFLSFSAFAQSSTTGSLSGTVLAEDGTPVPGATIVAGEGAYFTVANELGGYELSNVEAGDYEVTVSSIGFLTLTQKIKVNSGNESVLDFTLPENILQLDNILVTAEKRSEAIQQVPISVAAADAAQVKSKQISNVNQLGRITPNFLSFDDGGEAFPLVSVRGIITIDDSPIIGVYVDDVPFFNISSFPSYFNDIERIEVLKGPQGTLYGRNSIGGVVNIVTKRPTNDFKGFVSAGYGNQGQYEFQAGLSGPLVKDKLFYRLSGGTTARDGYVTNLFDNSDVLGREVTNGNLRLTYLATEDWVFSLNSSIEDRQNRAYAFVGNFQTSGAILDSLRENHPYEINQNAIGEYNTTNFNNSFKASYQGSTLAFDAITALQYSERLRAMDDFDFTPFDIQEAVSGENKLLTISQELRLRSTADGPFSWLGGLYLYRVTEDGLTQLGNGADNAFFQADPELAALYPFLQITDNLITQTGFSLFGEVSYKLSEELTITGGLRYELERSKLEEAQFYTRSGEAFQEPRLGAVPGEFELETNFDAVSPKLNLAFQASPTTLLYANVARGYRPGGVNPFINDPELAAFDPEFSWTYEIGTKNNLLDNRAKLNLTAFYGTYSDQQLFTILDLTTFAFGQENIGNSRNFGLELESELIVTPGLRVAANLGYLNAEFTDLTTRNFFTAEEIINDGNKQVVSPQWNGSLGANYAIDLS
ncbi:MAG: TonB-dependent receptor, partial [Bacteroidota bacterium]